MSKARVLLIGAVCAVAIGWALPATATPAHYTDGTQCDGGQFCALPSNPPPVAPHFTEPCNLLAVDPVSFVYLTTHIVYGTVAPPAGVVPVHDDTSRTDPYHANPPNLVVLHVANLVAGHRGFAANTWNIGKGVTAWVPFDCTPPPSTTTTSTTVTTTSTTVPSTTSTSTTVPSASTTTTSIEIGPPVEVAAPAPPIVTQPAFTG